MIYFDNNATTQIAPEVCEAIRPYLETRFGNPSSAYSAGRDARSAVENARKSVAALLCAEAGEIVFTSGGTESDNWAIRGALSLRPEKKHIITTRVEHEAVRKLCEELERGGHDVTWLDVDKQGLLDLEQLRASLRPDTGIVSVIASEQ
jgi:cysteine desulfurase